MRPILSLQNRPYLQVDKQSGSLLEIHPTTLWPVWPSLRVRAAAAPPPGNVGISVRGRISCFSNDNSMWCERRGSNPYSLRPRDFKSLASTNFATLARRPDQRLRRIRQVFVCRTTSAFCETCRSLYPKNKTAAQGTAVSERDCGEAQASFAAILATCAP